MIATPDNRVERSPLPPVHAEMADIYAQELEQAEARPHALLNQAKAWLGEHPRAALGLALGLGLTAGLLIKRVRKW